MKNNSTHFKGPSIGAMILWAILMILGLSGTIIIPIFLFASPSGRSQNTLLLILGFAGFALLTYFSIQKLIESNTAWMKGLKEHLLLPENILVQWEYSQAIWDDFRKGEMRRKSRSLTIAGVVIVLLVGTGLLIGFWEDEDRDPEMLIVMSPILMMMALLSWLFVRSSMKNIRSGLGQPKGQVIIGAQGILFNQSYLIPIDYPGAQLKAVQEENKYGLQGLVFFVEVYGGEANATHQHFVPIPQGKEEEVKELLQKFGSTNRV